MPTSNVEYIDSFYNSWSKNNLFIDISKQAVSMGYSLSFYCFITFIIVTDQNEVLQEVW